MNSSPDDQPPRHVVIIGWPEKAHRKAKARQVFDQSVC
jgi:hypothetical protein